MAIPSLGKTLFATGASTALVLALAPGAWAGTRFHDTGSETFDACGLTGIVRTWDAMVNEQQTPHGTAGLVYWVDSIHGVDRVINPLTGLAYTHVYNHVIKDQQITDNGDGTLTLTEHGAGGDSWIAPDGTVQRDTGTVTWQILVDDAGTPTDPSDDEFLQYLGNVRESTGTNIDTDFCDDFLRFTS